MDVSVSNIRINLLEATQYLLFIIIFGYKCFATVQIWDEALFETNGRLCPRQFEYTIL